MAEDIAISVNDVSKMYKLYDKPIGPAQGVPVACPERKNTGSIMPCIM